MYRSAFHYDGYASPTYAYYSPTAYYHFTVLGRAREGAVYVDSQLVARFTSEPRPASASANVSIPGVTFTLGPAFRGRRHFRVTARDFELSRWANLDTETAKWIDIENDTLLVGPPYY